MLIRILLLTLLLGIAYYIFMRRHKMPVHLLVMMAMLGGASFFVVFPEVANLMAHALGVGRGVDLIAYVIQTSLLFIVLHYYTKFVELESQMTDLVREIALIRAQEQSTSGGNHGS